MDWKSEKDYDVGERVFVLHEWFTCIISHKSNIFTTDLFDNKYWERENLRENG